MPPAFQILTAVSLGSRTNARRTSLVRTAFSVDNAKKTAGTQALQKLRLFTAIKTPFCPLGRMDLDAYDAHIEDQITNGVEGFIIGGTTGEGHLFSWDEHIMLIAHTKNKFGDRCTVVGNTGSNSTNEARHATRQGFAVGMDASLAINPYYGKTSEAGVLAHLDGQLEYGPAIIYNVPGRTGQDIPFETMMKIADHEHFAGVKVRTHPLRTPTRPVHNTHSSKTKGRPPPPAPRAPIAAASPLANHRRCLLRLLRRSAWDASASSSTRT